MLQRELNIPYLDLYVTKENACRKIKVTIGETPDLGQEMETGGLATFEDSPKGTVESQRCRIKIRRRCERKDKDELCQYTWAADSSPGCVERDCCKASCVVIMTLQGCLMDKLALTCLTIGKP